jgi:uncharacterized protein YkwD
MNRFVQPTAVAFAFVTWSCSAPSTPSAQPTTPSSPDWDRNQLGDQNAEDPWQPNSNGTAPDQPDVAPTEPPVRPTVPSVTALDNILGEHNERRARHCVAPLVWSAELQQIAQNWANQLAARGCVLEHSTGHSENLAMMMGGTLTGGDVVSMWYDEISLYDWTRPAFSMQAGHFTQVVWASTTQLGCAKASCGNGEVWVCNYAPFGNVQGEFGRQVKPLCRR